MRTRPPEQAKPDAVAGTENYNTAKGFAGTLNPRHLRALVELLRRPMPRKTLDQRAGCANAPELVAELRRRGLDVPCERIQFIDMDGQPCRPGVYSLSPSDRRKVNAWLNRRVGVL